MDIELKKALLKEKKRPFTFFRKNAIAKIYVPENYSNNIVINLIIFFFDSSSSISFLYLSFMKFIYKYPIINEIINEIIISGILYPLNKFMIIVEKLEFIKRKYIIDNSSDLILLFNTITWIYICFYHIYFKINI